MASKKNQITCRVCVERRRRDGKGPIRRATKRLEFGEQTAHVCEKCCTEMMELHRKGVKEGESLGKKDAKAYEKTAAALEKRAGRQAPTRVDEDHPRESLGRQLLSLCRRLMRWIGIRPDKKALHPQEHSDAVSQER